LGFNDAQTAHCAPPNMIRAGCCCMLSNSARLSIISFTATFTARFHPLCCPAIARRELSACAQFLQGVETGQPPDLQIAAVGSRIWVTIASIACTEGVAMSAQPAAILRLPALGRK